ncbi:LPD29 domain-containing protein [Streptomyces sp. NPDC002409]
MTETIPTSQVATALKRELRAAFPRAVFSVRKDREVTSVLLVSWTDGPGIHQVREIAETMRGARWENSFKAVRLPTLITVTIAGRQVTGWPYVTGFCLAHTISLKVRAEAKQMWKEAHGAPIASRSGRPFTIDGIHISADYVTEQITDIAERVILPRISAAATS